MAIAAERIYTPDDLLAMPDGERYDLVNGRLVEREMGSEASWVGGNVFGLVFIWNTKAKCGRLLPADASYQCFEEPNRVRRPDLSFVLTERLPAGAVPRGHIRVPPDLAVEVVPPNDLYSEVRVKVEEYLRAGVRLVWIVDRDTRSVEVFRADGRLSLLRDADELSGEDVLPEFRCRVGDLFPPAAGAAEV